MSIKFDYNQIPKTKSLKLLITIITKKKKQLDNLDENYKG